MALIRWSGFFGENRAVNPKLLPDGVGTLSQNQKPGRGDLRPWLQPFTVATVPAARNSIYRMGRDVASDAQYWLSWTGVVHAVRDFNQEDATERTFYTGDGTPKVTDNVMALSAPPYPTTSRPLGIPAPATPPLVVADLPTGAGNATTFFYAYTYVNDWGWESAPSPPSLIHTRKTDETATISGFAAVPAGNYQVDRIRIYRTQTGASGATTFFFLREIAIGAANTVDDNRTLGETMITLTWLPAPADLSFLTPMWNGMLAGVSGSGVRFCEPYIGYAWPVAYDALPPDSKAVALGVFGQNLLVLTTGRPHLVAGSAPDSLEQMPLEFPQACIAPRSVVSMGAGVAWASNDGLCWFGADGPRILTKGIMLREDWLAIKPETIIGKFYEGLYFGSYEQTPGTRKAFMIDPSNPQGIYWLTAGYQALHFDELQDQLYVLSGVNVQRWDAGAPMSVAAESKHFHQSRPEVMQKAKVVADAYPVTFTSTAHGLDPKVVTGIMAKAIPGMAAPTESSLRYTKTVENRKPFSLPVGFTAAEWQMGLSGGGSSLGAVMASTEDELRQV